MVIRIPDTQARSLSVYVPQPYSLSLIGPRSAIVGSQDTRNPMLIRIDYEDNRYEAKNLATYWDKLLHAACRHVQQYPATTRQNYPLDAIHKRLLEVGRFNYVEARRRLSEGRLHVQLCIKGCVHLFPETIEEFHEWIAKQ